MKIKFKGFWSRAFCLDSDYIKIKVSAVEKAYLTEKLKQLDGWQVKKDELKELDILIEFHYKKRSLDQNALMWKLYEITINEMEGKKVVGNQLRQLSRELYDDDIDNFAPEINIAVDEKHEAKVKDLFKISRKIPIKNGKFLYGGKITSSNFDKKTMKVWIDRLFDRLAEMGIDITDQKVIADYKKDWDKLKGGE